MPVYPGALRVADNRELEPSLPEMPHSGSQIPPCFAAGGGLKSLPDSAGGFHEPDCDFMLIPCLHRGSRRCGAAKTAKPRAESKELKVTRAISAAPSNIAKAAKVVDMDDMGNETVLREGTNGYTCYPGHPGAVAGQPFCANEAAVQWEHDLAAHKPKPTNAEPGIEYMLQGEPIGAPEIPARPLAHLSKNPPLDDHVAS